MKLIFRSRRIYDTDKDDSYEIGTSRDTASFGVPEWSGRRYTRIVKKVVHQRRRQVISRKYHVNRQCPLGLLIGSGLFLVVRVSVDGAEKSPPVWATCDARREDVDLLAALTPKVTHIVYSLPLSAGCLRRSIHIAHCSYSL